MLLYLIRHGKTAWNEERRIMGRTPVPLSEEGRSAVESLAMVLSRESIAKIYCSPVARAMESARILAQFWGVEVFEEPALAESDFESWVGKKYSELEGQEDFELYRLKPTQSRFSRYEDIRGVQKRALAAVERIRSLDQEGERIAIVSHSDIIKPIIAHFLDMDLDCMHRLSIACASASLLDLREEPPKVRYINYAPWKWIGGARGETS